MYQLVPYDTRGGEEGQFLPHSIVSKIQHRAQNVLVDLRLPRQSLRYFRFDFFSIISSPPTDIKIRRMVIAISCWAAGFPHEGHLCGRAPPLTSDLTLKFRPGRPWGTEALAVRVRFSTSSVKFIHCGFSCVCALWGKFSWN